MTHSIDAPLPPPTTTGTGAYAPTTTASPSTTDVARGEAKNVTDTAAQAGSQVASTAADQAKEVAAETQRQAKDLLDQGRAQLKDQALTQQQKAAQGLTSLADELRSLANGTSTGAPGPARDLLQQGAGMVETFAGKLQTREPAELLDEIRSFARRKPGMFLLGAAAAGIVAGRLTRGVQAAHSDSSGTGTAGFRGQTNYVDPAPTYSDVPATADYTTGSEFSSAGTAYAAPGTGTPLPPPPYGTVPPAGSVVPPATPAGWDDPSRRPGGVG